MANMTNNITDKNNDNRILGENIKNIRKNLNMTQEEFSEKINIGCQSLSKIETGKVGISLETAINICKIANCSSVLLFKDIIPLPNITDKYELLSDRDKFVINQLINLLLNNTKH